MATIINMPRLSDTMEEGVVASWLKNVGDRIEEGDILAEIETDKATMEFESFHEGVLLHIGVQEGGSAPVDTLLAIIGEQGEDIAALLNGGTAAAQVEEAPKAEAVVNEQVAVKSEAVAMPAGVVVINMPRLSDTMEEGTVASWLKSVGDTIEEGDILAEIETDKATMEFESFNEGVLLHIGVQEGEAAPVDTLLAIIGKQGTDVATVLSALNSGNASVSADVKSEEKTASKEEAPKEEIKVASETVTTTTSGGRIFASPLAKKIAKDKGFKLADIKGSGENGRIVKKDVENYTPAAVKVEAPVAVKKENLANFAIAGEENTLEVKNSQMRKAIAKALKNSKFDAPHFYLNIEVDMDNAMASRKIINAVPDTKVSFNDMVVKACAMALKKHPNVNTSWTDNTTLFHSHVHIGVAVAVDEGLVVPVVKHTDALSLTQIGASVRDLAGKARNKKIAPAEMQGSTFTVSNLGMFGIESFTSIINQPNSAILSVGAIVQKPVVKNGQIVVGNTMKLTLACDHRTVDGAVGAQFLQTLKTFVENPVTMLA
ncbi:2-oxo acid dehydrogenase subunit E2 [Tenacibaculum finnmarkense genomovar finnmarkense]|uniref:pyruvate dehydrogenase complex dihydrolipoamide acetyltransferase n=1 Tax=Tenacibaculum finnmarkense TaxID=2781243 RepID=UPI001E5B5494|nr:pyruvate dehydrogenase complex dihydrolipoamide acetyltransferase [Tenacibaculum finnmarkense]MCD8416407.1 2-oxo acid dehydrogenase subunit E2 [Tenacibaculum finnmarkense genomovar finnmarkense]MCG8185067.1 2-oxo acid dehydrogenase subunit E2 [Tenacibaculum finnmarkense genomovar finnmarkense]MCG8201099.1 2-oxo acid dehydrogenase subunit E2 [Tenacibaculum finnmarkense genomovar finnmarkense]MCG8209026.1 2-oxo acid dehydrogenase subunit E2 [Tenacibaculum finnmarkense genomovar finnmarkense]M